MISGEQDLVIRLKVIAPKDHQDGSAREGFSSFPASSRTTPHTPPGAPATDRGTPGCIVRGRVGRKFTQLDDPVRVAPRKTHSYRNRVRHRFGSCLVRLFACLRKIRIWLLRAGKLSRSLISLTSFRRKHLSLTKLLPGWRVAVKYRDPACAYCPPTVRACRQGEAEERGPGFCPTKVDPAIQNVARALYDDPETRRISRESALVESEGYCKWTRVEEIVQFAKRMGYQEDRHRELHQLRRSRLRV